MNTNIDSDADNLLAVMRKMHAAALEADWVTLENLNQRRNVILDTLMDGAGLENKYSGEARLEILQLDQAVLEISKQHLDSASAQVKLAVGENKIRQAYS